MKFTPLRIPDVILVQPQVFRDPRGFFFEAYHQAAFAANGIRDIFVQDNVSSSAKGVLRGLHYQIPPKEQAKLIRVLKGSILDVVLDLRKNSKTFGKHVSGVMNAETKEMLYIPKGFAHGFCAMEDGTEVLYKVSDFYSVEHERGIRWNDLDLAIDWPLWDFILSEKDKKFPGFKQALGL